MDSATSDDERTALERRARVLEVATLIWNTLEAVVSVSTGLLAHSLGLVAYGLDSCVEVFGSLVVLWQLNGRRHDQERSKRALLLMTVAFVVLAVYLIADAAHGLLAHAEPERNWFGLGFLAASVGVMFILATAKRATGRALDNDTLLANASLTMLDGILAGGILIAVFLAVQVHWWWADAVAAIIVAVAALNEARESWEEARG